MDSPRKDPTFRGIIFVTQAVERWSWSSQKLTDLPTFFPPQKKHGDLEQPKTHDFCIWRRPENTPKPKID